jgi:hypothetical protein
MKSLLAGKELSWVLSIRHAPSLEAPESKAGQGKRRSEAVWWACEDLNLGWLPYQIPRRIVLM